MQSSYEAYFLLAGLPLADPGRGVGRQLIPRGAQRLQGLLQRFE
jgi:hypothetical protein